MYSVEIVNAPPSQIVALAERYETAYQRSDTRICAPRTAAMSQDGELAVVLRNYAGIADRIRFWRSGGRDARTIGLPSIDVLAHGFEQARVFDSFGPTLRASSHFENVAIAEGGNVYATVVASFSGAFSGSGEAPFEYLARASRWRSLEFTNPLPMNSLALGGVSVSHTVVLNGDYRSETLDVGRVTHDPGAYRLEAAVVIGRSAASLGPGVTTHVQGSYVSGYDAGLTAMAPASPPHAQAIRWFGGKRQVLGNGVACSVNASGDAVGDDGAALGQGHGRPILWKGRASIPLSDKSGTAYAIGDDGTIVGSVEGNGFIVNGRDPRHRLHLLSDVVSDRNWSVSAGIGLTRAGSILALATRAGKSALIVLKAASSGR